MELSTLKIEVREGTSWERDIETEAQLAYRLLKKTEAMRMNLACAVPILQQFQELTRRSHQREIYDPEAISKILGELVVREAYASSPESSMINTPPGVPSLEEAIESVALTEGVIVGRVLGVAPEEIQKQALEQAYQGIMRRLATIIIQNRENGKLDVPRLVSNYEDTVNRYQQYVGAVTPPHVKFVQDGKEVERTTERIVYRGAVHYYLKGLHEFAQANPLNLVINGNQERWQRVVSRLTSYLPKCEFTDDERKQVDATITADNDIITQKMRMGKRRADEIERLHDTLYDGFTRAPSFEAAEPAWIMLRALSHYYAPVLDISDLDTFQKFGQEKLTSLAESH